MCLNIRCWTATPPPHPPSPGPDDGNHGAKDVETIGFVTVSSCVRVLLTIVCAKHHPQLLHLKLHFSTRGSWCAKKMQVTMHLMCSFVLLMTSSAGEPVSPRRPEQHKEASNTSLCSCLEGGMDAVGAETSAGSWQEMRCARATSRRAIAA
jgi:hypothetical protein